MNYNINISPNDVFAIGNHRFSCCDIEMVLLKEVLTIPNNIYLIYSDPPWNAGNAKMWRTLSKCDGIRGRLIDWDYFIMQLCIQIKVVNPDHIFLETGCKQTEDIINRLNLLGFPKHRDTWQVFYNSIHPNMISYFSDKPSFKGNPTGMKNEAMTKYIFKNIAKKNEIVFDPCIGLGMTARMAYNFDMICYGNDLNPERLEKTMLWLSKKTGNKIERI
jgi:DNA modification methylase